VAGAAGAGADGLPSRGRGDGAAVEGRWAGLIIVLCVQARADYGCPTFPFVVAIFGSGHEMACVQVGWMPNYMRHVVAGFLVEYHLRGVSMLIEVWID
jgi:hypothetical protein